MQTAWQEAVLAAHDRFVACADEAECWSVAHGLLSGIGIDWMTGGTAARDRPDAIAIVSTTPGVLMRDYLAASLHLRDPWMRHCATSATEDSVDIAELPASSSGLLPDDHALVALLADHGVRMACLSPVWRGTRPGGIVTYCLTPDGAAYQRSGEGEAMRRLMLASIAAWCRPERVATGTAGRYATGPELSPREVEALRWLACGLRTAEIAWRLGVEPVTVGKHLGSARRKLGARTREQALALALRDGVLTL